MELGATGEYPSGKLNSEDEGELAIGITGDEITGLVMLEFGKPVNWIGIYPAQARTIGEMLILKAALLEQKSEEKLDWDKALEHFRAVRQQYQDLVGMPGVNSSMALEHVFRPLSERYYRGERTAQLYQQMMSIE